ncbi:cysteine hydrolase family protein [Desulfallas thermosapovorans]|uniref:Nicotinamidase/pyrazinamidase n=1 Tax=Desulfallas thermosapovorans DSM 6562 TaxID=1121431 RepID=A0A5S4ZP15_9FIRM|nr:isochorismatase family cysteine hydrolase [Desulfallas thermosapovorans]TYO94474.1 nicotinamidase/pyrazinamidase [Desulfallas thermosapovorans DSM 6562]
MPGRVLLVVDMLNDFIREDGALYSGPEAVKIVDKVAALVKEFVSRQEAVIFIMDAHAPDDLEFKRFPAHCIKDTPGAEVIAELVDCAAPGETVYKVYKNRYSGFFNTGLEQILNEIEPDEVHVTGVCTNICVLYTVEELCNRDYQVVVHRDGVASFDQEAHRWALQQMESVLGVDII